MAARSPIAKQIIASVFGCSRLCVIEPAADDLVTQVSDARKLALGSNMCRLMKIFLWTKYLGDIYPPLRAEAGNTSICSLILVVSYLGEGWRLTQHPAPYMLAIFAALYSIGALKGWTAPNASWMVVLYFVLSVSATSP